MLRARSDQLDLDQPVGERHRGLDRVRQPLAQVGLHHQPVDDDRDVVLVLLVEHDLLVEPAQLAVDLDPAEALGAQLLELLAVLALAPAHDRGHHHEAGPVGQLHHLVDDLLGRLAGDRAAADVAVGMADPRPQQPQVVVDLGDRADRRARVARGRLLVDRDRRRQPLDRVDVGLVHLAQELPGVRRQRLDVATLALGVDRVERQRRLPGPRQPGDHGQRVPRNRHRHVLEIVLAGTRDDEFDPCSSESSGPNRRSHRKSAPSTPSAPISPTVRRNERGRNLAGTRRPAPRGVRASDEDREQLIAELNEHSVAGRLTPTSSSAASRRPTPRARPASSTRCGATCPCPAGRWPASTPSGAVSSPGG